MKKMLLTAMGGLLWLNSYSQTTNLNFEAICGLFNKNSSDVIEMKNKDIKRGFDLSQLRDVNLEDNGFNLFYTIQQGSLETSESYSFNKLKMCVNVMYIQDKINPEYDEFTSFFLKNNFTKKAKNIFYHNKLDLMVKVDVSAKYIAYDYSNKPYKTSAKK